MPLSRFPRVPLANLPTLLQHLPRYGQLIGHDQVYIKRDDVMALGMGGNKLRNLEFWLGEALHQGADLVLAAGMLQSNQCRLTAAAAAKLGLECILVHNEKEPGLYQGNMLLNHLAGAKSLFIGPVDEEQRSRRVETLADELRRQGRQPYIIGDQPLGALGYANAAQELHQQAEGLSIDLRHVVIVGAMGPTAAGFLFGTTLLDAPFQVHVISVEYEEGHLRALLKAMFGRISDLVGVEPGCAIDEVMIVDGDFLGDGYGKPTAASLQAAYDLASHEGIFVENVYTSKTLGGLRRLVEDGRIPRGEPVCFIHTGGAPALFAQAELFQPGRGPRSHRR